MFHRSVLLAVALAVTGCRCNPRTETLFLDLSTDKKVYEFTSCVTKDNTGAPINGIVPAEQRITIKNDARISGTLSYKITGDQAAYFSVDEARSTKAIGAAQDENHSIEVIVLFSPTKAGSASAQLEIDDGLDSTPVLNASLSGLVPSELSLQPKMTVKVQSVEQSSLKTCLPGLVCKSDFGTVLFGHEKILDVEIESKGCPDLTITSLDVALPEGFSDQTLQFFLDEPKTRPSVAAPLRLSATGTNNKTTLKILFAADSIVGSNDDFREAVLNIESNDTNYGSSLGIGLSGIATAPNMYVNPTLCDYAAATDTCGSTGAKVPGQASFQVRNNGGTAITVNSVLFKSNNATSTPSGFKIMQDPSGMTIQPGSSANLVVTFDDAGLRVTDLLIVKASGVGDVPGSAGEETIQVMGGRQPCLETDPATTLDFKDSVSDTVKPVKIKNAGDATKCGDLLIKKSSITEGNDWFSFAAPAPTDNIRLKPNEESIVNILYKKPGIGGQQIGELFIETNANANKIIRLYSNAPLDPYPDAVVKACLVSDTNCDMGSTGSFSVSLNALGAMKTVKIDGASSIDTNGMGPSPIKSYRFTLAKKPGGAANAQVAQNGLDISESSTILTLDSQVTGTYIVSLTVTDSADKVSARTDVKIQVSQ